MNEPAVQVVVPASNEYIDVVCLTLYGMANKLGFSYEEIEDLKVAVTEAFDSTIQQHDAHDQIRVCFYRQMDALCISINDDGERSMRQPVAANLASPMDQRGQKGGIGLYLLQALVDEVKVRTEWGTEFILMKYYNRSEQTL